MINKETDPKKRTVWLKRTIWLSCAAGAGLLLGKILSQPLQKWLGVLSEEFVSLQIGIFLMSLPVLFVLWHFRTADTLKQIQKAQENAEATRASVEAARKSLETAREALNTQTLGRYLSMLFSKNIEERCVGLIRLAEIKRQGNFVDEIDVVTRRRLDLNGANLQGENLSGLNLEEARLEEANLSGTDLTGANLRHAKMHKATLINTILVEADLQWATLTETILTNADLSDSKLQNAVFIGATYWEQAKFKGAKFHPYGTKLPEHFGDPETRGMVRVNEPFSRP
jgi:hypothetical protein